MNPLAQFSALLARKGEDLARNPKTPDWVKEEHNRAVQAWNEVEEYVQNLERQYHAEQVRGVSLSTACALLEKELAEQIKSDLYQGVINK